MRSPVIVAEGTGPEWSVGGVAVTVRRSARRRTVALQVAPGRVTLYAPARYPAADLQRVLVQRRAWVERHLAGFAARAGAGPSYADGSPLPFLGETLTLRHQPGLRVPRREGDFLLVPAGDAHEVARQVEGWTRRACLPAYRAVVADYAGHLGADQRLGQIAVTSAAQRWGSCTADGNIRLHWKLTRAPLDVLHYVALHEAAHLLELNHSARYWAHVRRLMPEYAAHRQWLREHGHTL